MAYRIELSRQADRQLRKLPRAVQERLGRTIDALGLNPRPDGYLKLTGMEDTFRVREGDFRIIYQIRDQQLLVLVLALGHRRDVYR